MIDSGIEPPVDARVLVTGGTGFIGRLLVRRLVNAGCHVSCLVRATSATQHLQSMGVSLLTSELDDADAVQRAVTSVQPAVVFHAAGVVRAIRRSAFDRVNVEGTAAVAAACAACADPPVLVVVSSLAAAGPSPVGRLRTEADEPNPVSAYGRSKRGGELAAAKYASEVPTTVVRPPIVFGPEDHGVLQMMRPIARWGVHAVPNDGAFGLSMVHVDDLVDGLILAWQRGHRVQARDRIETGAYFIGAPEQPTYAALGHMMGRAMDVPRVRVLQIPAGMLRLVGLLGDVGARVSGRPTWVNGDKVGESLAGAWTCSCVRAQEQLGWTPATPLEQQLRETAQWYRQAGWL